MLMAVFLAAAQAQSPLSPVSGYMSSTLLWDGHDFGPSACYDGITTTTVTTGNPRGWNFCHSLQGANQWLSLQLASESTVSRVIIYGREDFGQEYLAQYQVWITRSAGIPSSSNGQLCNSGTAPATVGPFYVECPSNVAGTYVTLFLPGNNRWLQIAEMTIYGTSSSVCPNPPCAAPLLGDVAVTTATGADARSGTTFDVGENVYGPFENAFGSQQDNVLQRLGCNPGSLGHLDGGIDTLTAEQMVAHQCGITLPRVENGQYISLMDECGGHTQEYHFHERLSCLYELSGVHSSQVGVALDGTAIFGKWENYSARSLPALDACGAHFGVTPMSNGANVYHYHVQDFAPFTVGCYGPSASGGLVSPSECRSLYPACNDGITTEIETPAGRQVYDAWCPCYDASLSNVLDGVTLTPTAAPTAAPTTAPTAAPTAAPTVAPTPAPTPVTYDQLPAISATMSDTLDSSNWAGHTFGASRCIDGVYGLGSAQWSFCNSNLNQNNPWLSVQYASGSYIDSVSIYTRSDCCQRFLSQFEVYVGSSAGNPLSGSMTRCGSTQTAPATVGPHSVSCQLSGNYVALLLPGSGRMLAVDELISNGLASTSPTPNPTSAPTSAPTLAPTQGPTSPVTPAPSSAPTVSPSPNPTPTSAPTAAPTQAPTSAATYAVLPAVSATMSDTLDSSNWAGHTFGASRCIDGVYGLGNAQWSFCNSNLNQNNPWLSVQYTSGSYIDSVSIYTRSDCCQRFLSQFEVYVGSSAGNPLSGSMTRCGSTQTAPATVGPHSVSCQLSGNYVALLLPGSGRMLAVDELISIGLASSSPTPTSAPTTAPTVAPTSSIALLPAISATMSDTLDSSNWAGHTFGASRCIDGVYGLGNTRWSFCNSNLNQNNPWLSVQYASGSYIDSVSIYTRSDCCQRFLSQFEVYVGSSAGNPLSGSMTRCGSTQTAPATVGPHSVSCQLSGNYVALLLPGSGRMLAVDELISIGLVSSSPTPNPTSAPTSAPTLAPTQGPTSPVTPAPSSAPTVSPSPNPTPTSAPTAAPTQAPTSAATYAVLPAVSATMSDTLDSSNWAGHTFGASRCIDGVYGLGNTQWSFCNSNLNQNNPWLSVQYTSGSYIDSVSIYTRSDCCQRFLSQFEVYVGSSAGNPLSGSMTRCGSTQTAPATVGPHSVSCQLSGNYVALLLPGSGRMLAVDELISIGLASSSPTPTSAPTTAPTVAPTSSIALLPAISATMSDTLDSSNWAGHTFGASRCIDGVYGLGNTRWSFCNSNLNQNNPWLSVQYASGSYIDSVSIYTRSDCCQRFLSQFEVYVGSSAGNPLSGSMTRCGSTQTAPATVGPHSVSCQLSGNYVALLLPGSGRMLAVDELESFGR